MITGSCAAVAAWAGARSSGAPSSSRLLSGTHERVTARRSLVPGEKGTLELAYFLWHAPGGATLAELVAVAGARWAVEDCFAEAKNETGLDQERRGSRERLRAVVSG